MPYFLFTFSTLFFWNLFLSEPIDPPLKDKTLITWVTLDNLNQQGGSALTIDGGGGLFDGIVFGEKAAGKWMAGSNNFLRTEADQSKAIKESSEQEDFVQIVIVYRGTQIKIYRKGRLYTSYDAKGQQEFSPEKITILFGLRHLDAGGNNNSLSGKIKEARIYDFALNPEQIKNLDPGNTTTLPKPWAWWDFSKGIQDLSGRFRNFELTGDAHITNGVLVLPGNNSALIASVKETEWESSSPVPSTIIKNTRVFREKLLSDPYRPAYHFCLPEDQGYPGDPNGAFYHNGRYHLMYLYNRSGNGFSWGHVSSTDLLHWRHHPDAIGPGNGDEGCFSGGAYVDENGKAYLSYWMLWGAKGIGIAESFDKEFNSWKKSDFNPVIPSSEWGITQMNTPDGDTVYIGSADPSNIWKENGQFYMLTGNLLVLNKLGRQPDSPPEEQGDRLYLWKSKDLKSWEYVNRFYESNRTWTQASEDNMCPSFLPLPMSPDGGEMSKKHLLLFISHNLGCQYYIGDYREDHFYPTTHGRMTWKDNSYFAPEALMDGHGRQIMWSWIFDERPADIKSASGWTGTYGLPRSLWLGDDGNLRISPVEELKTIRYNGKTLTNLEIDPKKEKDLLEFGAELMELEIVVDPLNADKIGVKVCISEDRQEYTSIYYDAANKTLNVDTRKSGLSFGKKTIESAPFDLAKEEVLKLRIYVDRSIVEVFSNDRQAIARRIYPTLKGTGVTLFAEGGKARVKTLNSWELSPTNPY